MWRPATPQRHFKMVLFIHNRCHCHPSGGVNSSLIWNVGGFKRLLRRNYTHMFVSGMGKFCYYITRRKTWPMSGRPYSLPISLIINRDNKIWIHQRGGGGGRPPPPPPPHTHTLPTFPVPCEDLQDLCLLWLACPVPPTLTCRTCFPHHWGGSWYFPTPWPSPPASSFGRSWCLCLIWEW